MSDAAPDEIAAPDETTGLRAGRVVRVDGPRFLVDLRPTPDDPAVREVACTVRGRLKKGRRKQKQPVVVGDAVWVDLSESEDDAELEGAIERVDERRTKLSRRAAGSSRLEQLVVANVDQLLIVSARRNPPFRTGLVDRMLVAAAQGHLEPLIVLNKDDLSEGGEDAVDEALALYAGLGYRVLRCSAHSGEGLDELRDALTDRSSVLAGHSGVGKSTLINALCPGLDLKTGAISEASHRGRHTTTWVSLLRLPFGGYVVDTPGIRSFSIWDLDPADLDIFFPELEPLIERCKYPNCSHTHEPKCAVKAAVEDGAVTASRYESYLAIRLSILEDLEGFRR